MSTPVLYSKITKGEDLDKVTTPEKLEVKKNFALLTNYTKIIKANIQQDSSSIILNSTHGVITGQPISGNGIDEYTFITEVNYTTNTVTIDRPILNGGSNISISINNYQEHADEEMDDGPYEFNYQYPTHFDWLQEDFNQNY